MGIPERVADWTFTTVEELVRTYGQEPGWFDWKEVLNPSKGDTDKFNRDIRKAACGMANTDGGYIVFGVADPRNRSASADPASLIVGIPNGELRKEFGEKLKTITPDVGFDTIPRPIALPSDPSRCIFVAQIPRSQRRPHMFEGIFYRRDEGGFAVAMSFYEVREQMLSTEERLRRVALLRLELAECRALADLWQREGHSGINSFERFDLGSYKPLLADICPLLPQDGLLQRMLRIPQLARAINEALTEWIAEAYRRGTRDPNPPMGSHLYWCKDNIDRDSRELIALCEECESRLCRIFGPLVG